MLTIVFGILLMLPVILIIEFAKRKEQQKNGKDLLQALNDFETSCDDILAEIKDKRMNTEKSASSEPPTPNKKTCHINTADDEFEEMLISEAANKSFNDIDIFRE